MVLVHHQGRSSLLASNTPMYVNDLYKDVNKLSPGNMLKMEKGGVKDTEISQLKAQLAAAKKQLGLAMRLVSSAFVHPHQTVACSFRTVVEP